MMDSYNQELILYYTTIMKLADKIRLQIMRKVKDIRISSICQSQITDKVL